MNNQSQEPDWGFETQILSNAQRITQCITHALQLRAIGKWRCLFAEYDSGNNANEEKHLVNVM